MTSYTSDGSSVTDHEDEFISDLTDEELYNLVNDTIRSNEILKIETQMFEKYIKRVDPKDLGLQLGASGKQSSQSQENSPRSFRKRSKSRGQSIDRHLKLSSEQKCDIATRELDELREDMERSKDESEKVLDNYKAVMEEADVRYTEIKKAQYEFNRDVVNNSVNERTKKIIAEKVQRYFEDKLRSKDTLIEKLRLKNSTLKVQKKKLHLQLKQKEEMGEVLHEVDFNQLKIENSQYLEKIDERNQDLLRLKLMAGDVTQVLNSYRKKLHLLTQESNRLKTEIAQREEMMERVKAETGAVEKEKSKARKINADLQQQLSGYKVPEAIDYVKEKDSMYEMKQALKSWERKVDIAEMALKSHKKTWQHMQETAQQEQNQWTSLNSQQQQK